MVEVDDTRYSTVDAQCWKTESSAVAERPRDAVPLGDVKANRKSNFKSFLKNEHVHRFSRESLDSDI